MPPKYEQQETLSDKLMLEYAKFISDGEYTADEMRVAYFLLLEGKEGDGESERTEKLLTKMKELEAEGLPLNRFARIIEKKDDFEIPKERFVEYISSLPISPKEKSVLQSIMEKCRSGSVEIYLDNKLSITFEIDASHASSDEVGRDLKDALDTVLKDYVPQRKISITFEER